MQFLTGFALGILKKNTWLVCKLFCIPMYSILCTPILKLGKNVFIFHLARIFVCIDTLTSSSKKHTNLVTSSNSCARTVLVGSVELSLVAKQNFVACL